MYKSLENNIRGIMSQHYISEAKMGSKDYPHLDLCPTAIKQFTADLKDKGENDPKVHAAIKAVNDYLAIEQKAMDGNGTEDDLDKMEDLVDVAKQKISDAGLSGHDYHQMHLDKTEDMIEDDDDDMEEQNGKPPFTPDSKTSGPRKDRFGNVIKKKNIAKHLAKQGMRSGMKSESVLDQPIMRANPEDNAPASPDEMGMALQQLKFIKYATDEIAAHIAGGGRYPEWMQNKLTKANYIMKGLHANIDQEYSDDMGEAVNMNKVRSTYNNIMKGGRQGPPDDKEVGDYIGKGMSKADIAALIKMLAKQGYDAKFLTKDLASLAEEVELEEANKAAAELKDYANKRGGMDKDDFHTAAKHIETGNQSALKKHLRDLDTSPREKILSVMNKHGHDIGKMGYKMRREEAELDEKTLTPAEKKKREEIAKAIERDNPDMPMDKKMAIATDTAKKVAEDTVTEGFVKSLFKSKLNKKS
jgi:hypothetical protein